MRTISFALLFLLSIAAAKAVQTQDCIGACPAPMSLASFVF